MVVTGEWPVALACANWHYVCRYDDGRRVYNIEATDTGRGGFAAGTDEDYVEKEGVSPKAVAAARKYPRNILYLIRIQILFLTTEYTEHSEKYKRKINSKFS